MTDTLPNDGLLKAARALSTLFMVVLGFVVVGLAVAIPVILLNQSHVADQMVAGATASLGSVLGAITVMLVLCMGLAALACHFFQLLRQLIGSVGKGDPFNVENADRLRRMGWIAVGIELLNIPVGAMAGFLITQFKPDTINVDLDFDPMGILVILLLFILARVFRHGAALREDLEGTV